MKKALGKGLSALIPDTYVKKAKQPQAISKSPGPETSDAAPAVDSDPQYKNTLPQARPTEPAEKKSAIESAKEAALAKILRRENPPSTPIPHSQPTTEPLSVKPVTAPVAAKEQDEVEGFKLIPIHDIKPNHDQPRKEFSPEAIEDLAASIKENGILQPVIVKKLSENQYELICGERRLRAATLCGLAEIPAVVKDAAEDEFLEWAIIENIQREDLNAIEEAEAYKRLVDERGLSQDEVAKTLGKSRTAVTNTMRLLRLPEDVRDQITSGDLSAGHARAILGLITPEHQRQMAKRIAEDNLSVRQVELIVNRSNAQKRKAKPARKLKPEIVDLENRLSEHFGTQVKVTTRSNMKQGRIEIHYFSLDDLDRVLEKAGLPQK